MKICPVGDQMLCADRRIGGWTDMMMLIVAFRNFVNAPKMTYKMMMTMYQTYLH
jgi:hypothetical protein